MDGSIDTVDFDEIFDVIIIGYGFAGALAAITAADNGASVLLAEKAEHPGGISICSGGAMPRRPMPISRKPMAAVHPTMSPVSLPTAWPK
jgi:glycine/D-amino acid oxidase-like deaminating enzyme